MILIGQNFKHVHMTYSFLEPAKYKLQRKSIMKSNHRITEIKAKRDTVLLVPDIDLEKSSFLHEELKCHISNF